jgi:hypothetical protein
LSPSSFTIDESGSVSTTLTVTSVNGFNSAVDLSVNEFPSGVSATASANPVTPPANGSVKVTITWSASRRAPTGTTTIELIGDFRITHQRDTRSHYGRSLKLKNRTFR